MSTNCSAELFAASLGHKKRVLCCSSTALLCYYSELHRTTQSPAARGAAYVGLGPPMLPLIANLVTKT